MHWSLADALNAPSRQSSSLEETAHRPWPLPERPWVMGQTWDDLLFAHWPLDPDVLRPHVPRELTLDVRDGRAWLGITPFVVTGLQLVMTPALPRLSTFPELNVRTYITVGGKPGIYFFSLDAASDLAVRAARRFYRLPYFRAAMTIRRAGAIEYVSRRRGEPRELRATYEPTGPPAPAEPGSLEHFLAERYCLYTVDAGRVYRAEIHHPPWPLQPARARFGENTMAPVPLPDAPPVLHYSVRQDVLIWRLAPVGGR